jgi:hypothetical protein
MSSTVEGTTVAGVPVGGVSLTAQEVKVMLLDGLARTEVVEELSNATDETLEGRYRFRVPEGASLPRLALWFGDRLVEAEMVDRERGRAVYETITGARRDPALLERQSNRDSLRVYPIPPRGSRRVLVAYDQILTRRGGRLHYAFPLAPLARGLRRTTISVSGRHAGQPLADLRVWPARARVERADGITRIHFERSLAQPFDAFLADLASPELRLSYRGPDGANEYSEYTNASLSQWYNACTSHGAHTYPYGSAYDGTACDGIEHWPPTDSNATLTVGSLWTCQSNAPGYSGVYDLSGNVGEWEDSCFGTDAAAPCHVRGGYFGDLAGSLICGSDFVDVFRIDAYMSIGFRCCSSP